MNSYLIKDTTREEREKIVNKALAISLTGADMPSDITLKLAYEYIEGRMELDEVQKKVIEEFKND